MVCECVAQPMRFPKKLIDQIDKYIQTDNFYTTRPDFILDAVRFSYWKLSEKYASVFEMTADEKSPYHLYKGREKELMQISADVLLAEYHEYGDEAIQVMLRFPKGLTDDIENNILGAGLCKNRADFVRLSIIYKISHFIELKDLWKKIEVYNKEVKEGLKNSVLDTILSDFKNKTLFETAKTVAGAFNKNDS